VAQPAELLECWHSTLYSQERRQIYVPRAGLKYRAPVFSLIGSKIIISPAVWTA